MRTDFNQVLKDTCAAAYRPSHAGACGVCGRQINRGTICKECHEKEQIKARRENIWGWVAKLGVGKRYQDCSLATFRDGAQYVEFCKRWLVDRSESVFFCGGYGSGKTHLAVAICRELLQDEKPPVIVFESALEMLFKIRATFDRGNDENEVSLLKKYAGADFLVIDDLGAERSTPWVVEVLTMIIDRRDRDLRPTIITSNLSLEEIAEKLNGRIASRIANGRVVKVSLGDYRLKRAERRVSK